jgi:hypothetical protein
LPDEFSRDSQLLPLHHVFYLESIGQDLTSAMFTGDNENACAAFAELLDSLDPYIEPVLCVKIRNSFSAPLVG